MRRDRGSKSAQIKGKVALDPGRCVVTLDKTILRLEALAAEVAFGIDPTRPGWRDKYLRCVEEDNARLDEQIAEPHAPQFAVLKGGRDAS